MGFLPKLFTKMYFLFHPQAFDGAMKLKVLKFLNLNIVRTKRAFEVK